MVDISMAIMLKGLKDIVAKNDFFLDLKVFWALSYGVSKSLLSLIFSEMFLVGNWPFLYYW
jgi:hypothetical protein